MEASPITAAATNGHDHRLLHLFFFPYLACGHLIPLAEMARLFAERRGVKVSYVTTPGNVPLIRHVVDGAVRDGLSMQLLLLPFPCEEVCLPAGCENTASIPASDAKDKFCYQLQRLQGPLEQLIREHRPDCLVADEAYHWASDLAISVGVPRVVFVAIPHFTVAVTREIELHDAHLAVSGDFEPFVVPGGLPHEIRLTKAELPRLFRYPKFVLDIYRDAYRKSYGLVMNSFDELAPEYAERLKECGQRRVWNVGPVWLRNRTTAGHQWSNAGEEEVVIEQWLKTKEDGSVLYVAFGSESIFSDEQLREISLGLEASGRPFIWAVRSGGGGLDTIEEWLPEGLKKKVAEGGDGLILKKWAPQQLILNHPAVGGFVTHAGWNSVTEALSAGVPMVTWPLHSEQFVNEKLVVQFLGTGVTALGDGVRRSVDAGERGLVRGEAVKRAVERVMGGGEEAEEMRRKAKKYEELSRSVVREGGSSYDSVSAMIEELRITAAMAAEGRKN